MEKTQGRIHEVRSQQKKLACVSYAWEDERRHDCERGKKVEDFCARLTSLGFDILRDTTDVKLGDRLSKFMRQIGNHDRIYVFLSDAYLKSPNCMYELLVIWQSSGDDPSRFLDRIRVRTMPGTDIYSIPGRMRYAAYWKEQRDEIKRAVDESGAEVLGPTDLRNWKYIMDFTHHVDEMLAQIVDVLVASDFDEFMDNAEEELGKLALAQ